MYVTSSHAEVQTPTNWDLIVAGMTAPLSVLSPSNILPSLSYRPLLLSPREGKYGVFSKNVIYS